MAGLVATFVFAGQMMNFPVGAGTSGHLLGGALAAVLVGPWTGRALHQRRAARPGAAHGRRRHHRARHQHHADGAGRRRRRLAASSSLVRRLLPQAYQLGRAGRGRRRPGQRPGGRGRLLAPLRGRRHRAGRPRHGPRRDGRLARRDRDRRGRHHRAGGRQRGRRPTRPGPAAPGPRWRPASSRSEERPPDEAGAPSSPLGLLVCPAGRRRRRATTPAPPRRPRVRRRADRLPRHRRGLRRPPTARSPTTRPRASTTTGSAAGSPASSASS